MNATRTEPRNVVTALIDEGLLSAANREQAGVVVERALMMKAPSPRRPVAPLVPSAGPRTSRLVEISAYAGAALVFAAGAIFLFQKWFDLARGQQVAALGAVTLVLAIAAVIVGRTDGGFAMLDHGVQDSRRRLTGTLFTGAAYAACFMVGEWIDMHTSGYDDRTAIAAVLTLLLGTAIGYRLAPTAFAQLTLTGGVSTLVWLVFELAGHPDTYVIGIVDLALAAGYLFLTERGVLREQMVARVIGCGWALYGAQSVVLSGHHDTLGYTLTVLVGLAGFAVYAISLGWPYVAVGVLSITFVVPEVVLDLTDGSFGAATAVLLTGVTLLAASFAGFRIREGVDA